MEKYGVPSTPSQEAMAFLMMSKQYDRFSLMTLKRQVAG